MAVAQHGARAASRSSGVSSLGASPSDTQHSGLRTLVSPSLPQLVVAPLPGAEKRSEHCVGAVTAASARSSAAKRASQRPVHQISFADVVPQAPQDRAASRGVQRPVHQISFADVVPEASQEHGGDRRGSCEDLRARIASLFNCSTLSDVTFLFEGDRRMPAHSFILASASPVFRQRLHPDEEVTSPRGALRRRLAGDDDSESDFASTPRSKISGAAIAVDEAPHSVFFELLRYIYTDEASINLESALSLILLADKYQVKGLGDRCAQFLRDEAVPPHALRVLHILEGLMLKACLTMWKEIVDQTQAKQKFRQLSLHERRTLVDGIETPIEASGARTPGRGFCGSRRASTVSFVSAGSAQWPGYSRRNSTAMERADWDDGHFHLELAQGFSRKKVTFGSLDASLKSQLLNYAPLAEEISTQCWKCVQEETDAVISGADMLDIDLRTLRQILKLTQCSVPEITLFRAVNEWADRRCQKLGLAASPENKREVLGEGKFETMTLIRFPAMTLEQFEWEVVPTGLLEYHDVQEVLRCMTCKQASVGRFISKPRLSVSARWRQLQQARRPSMHPGALRVAAGKAASTQKLAYAPVPGDPIDSMLGSELLRVFLASQAQPREPVLTTCHEKDPFSATLPPLTARGAGQGSRPTLLTSRPQQHSCRPPGSRGRTARAALPTPRPEQPPPPLPRPWTSGAGAVRPRDFRRLAAGLYCFREASLLEIRLQGGEAVVFDHGPHSELLACAGSELRGASSCVLRRLFGLGERLPAGKGVPLASFLCRQ